MEELLGRQIPHSTPAEQAVIGSMLIDPRCIPLVINIIKAADFYTEANAEIFETLYSMFSFGRAIDPVTVLDEMKSRGVYREGRSQSYLMELMQVTPTAANVEQYANIVRDRSLLRSLGSVGDEIGTLAREGAGEADVLLESAERKIYGLRKDRDISGLVPVGQVVHEVYTKLTELAESGGQIPGLSTGLSVIDNSILGMGAGDLILIASRPGMGKTSIALNMALHVGKTAGKTVAIFSLEMSREQLVMRLLSGESMVDSKKLQTGKLSTDEWRRISSAAASLSGLDIRISDNPSLSVADMNSQCRRLDKLGLVVIDYLQLMQSAGGTSNASENRTQVVSDISRMLKIMAKELRVPILCLSQFSRANEKRPDKRPMLSDLRESGAIEQDADVVIGLYREGYYNEGCENPNEAEAILLKNRRGSTGTLKLMWLPDFTTFAPMEERYEE